MTGIIRAELLKLRTTRTTLGLVLSMVLSVVVGVAAAITTADRLGGAALSTNQGIRTVFSAAASGGIVMLLLGILAVTGEHRHGTATSTFLVVPRRGRLLVAKLAAVVLVGDVLGLLAVLLTVAIGIPWLSVEGVEVSPFEAPVRSLLIGALAGTVLYGALGVGVGALLRHQAAAVTIALLWVLVAENLLISFLPEIGKWLPGGAAAALTGTTPLEGGMLPMWGGGLLFTGYAVAFAAAGVLLAARRDVS